MGAASDLLLTESNISLGAAMKHPVADLVKPSFVIFDIRAL